MPEETPLLVITTRNGELLTYDATASKLQAEVYASACGECTNMRAVVMPVQTVLDMWKEIAFLAEAPVGCACDITPVDVPCLMCRLQAITNAVQDTGANPNLPPSTTHA